MINFDYRKPASLEEAQNLRAEYGFASHFLMGGTDLTVEMDQGLLSPELLIDLKGIEAFKIIREESDELVIGAGVTFSELIKSSLIQHASPSLIEASKLVASVGVRNVATLSGNICHAVPSADGAAPLLIRDAILTVSSTTGSHSVSIHDFFQGPRKTVLSENELITEIRIKKNKAKFGEHYLKLGRYRGEDLAQVGVAVSVDEKFQYKIAYAAVSPVPVRICEAEEVLQSNRPNQPKIEKAIEIIKRTVSPIDDIRASKEYRLYMCGVMFEKALYAALERMQDAQSGKKS